MRIWCPHCGLRDHGEFGYLGDASVKRPEHGSTDMAVWNEYVFQRSNPRGLHQEHWQHSAGCRAILRVERDTLSHKIVSVALEGEWG